jgi:competence protein ComEC
VSAAPTASGPLMLLAGLVVGILLGERLGPAAATAVLLASLVSLAGAVALRSRLRLAIAVVGLALLGSACMQRSLHGISRSPLSTVVSHRSDAIVRGALVGDPNGARFGARALVRLSTLDRGTGRASAGGRTVLVVASGEAAPRLRLLAAGDRVELAGRFGALDGFDARFRWRHAVARFDARDVRAVATPRSPLAVLANHLRALVTRGGQTLPPTERSLMAGFLLGDTRAVPDRVTADFHDSGLTHLLAVSGENVAFVLALAGPVLRRLGLRGRLLGALVVLVVFGTMARWEPSVLRAGAMAACSMTALYLGRPATGLRVLALAATALLVADPFLLHSVGFLLSCGATAGIAMLAPPIAQRLRGPIWLRESLGVTAGAQVGVAPVLIPVFGSMPLATLPANLLAVPVVGPLTVWGLFSGVAGGLVRSRLPAAAALLQVPDRFLLRYVEAVAAAGARVPLAINGRGACALAAVVCTAAAAIRAARALGGRLRRDVAIPSR